MKKLVFFSLFLFSDLYTPFAQELHYDISINSKSVGSLLVNKKVENDSVTHISAVSEVQYTFFRNVKLVYLYEAIFINDSLSKAYFIYKKNDDTEEEAKLVWTAKNGYHSTREEFHQKQKEKLSKSMIQLYFEKPKNNDLVFSERFHDFVKIAYLGDNNKYVFQIPNGDKSIYQYNNKGICKKISISSTFINFDMTLKE